MTRRRPVLVCALLGAAVAGSVITIAVGGRSTAATPSGVPPLSTATVTRTDLVTTALTEGTLGYVPTGPLVNRVVGTYTALPAPGTTIHPGGALYRVDDLPVVLMAGATPAWRSFTPGMTDGPDVIELQADLIALGHARGLLSAPTGRFDAATASAVERWQSAEGYPANGQIALGQVVFLTGDVRVGALSISEGQAAAPGDDPYRTTTASRAVTVPVDPNLPAVTVGEPVSIVLPTNATTPGTITAIGPAPSGTGSGSQGSSSSGSGSGGGPQQPQPSAILTVTPDRPADTGTGSGVAVQVSLTTRSATNVLAVPISALLALAGGGYGVEVLGPSGGHHLVGVTTGIFTGSQVQISGTGIDAGTKVVVAQ